MKNLSSTVKMIIGGGVIAVLLVVWLIWYSIGQGVISEGNKLESGLGTAYSNGAIYLSNCVVKTNQVANVAGANADRFDKVVKDAVAGNGAFHTDTSKTVGGLVPILVQTYPDFKGAQSDLYTKVANTIIGCQDDFRNQQSAVLDQVRSFNSWLGGSWKVRHFGSDFPNNKLTVHVPGLPVLHGQAALDKISTPIVDAVTSQSYQNGQQPTNGPFTTPSSSPTN